MLSAFRSADITDFHAEAAIFSGCLDISLFQRKVRSRSVGL